MSPFYFILNLIVAVVLVWLCFMAIDWLAPGAQPNRILKVLIALLFVLWLVGGVAGFGTHAWYHP